MSNKGVRGYVVDSNGNGIKGLMVVAYDVEAIDRDIELGTTTTSSTGHYTITYPTRVYGWLESEPDIKIRVFDSVKRLISESPVYENVSETTRPVDTITIRYADLHGWLVNLRSGIVEMVTQDNRVTLLIDNRIAWEQITDAVEKASNSIHCAQLLFDVGDDVFCEIAGYVIPRLFTVFDPPMPPIGIKTNGKKLEDLLLNANKTKGVAVHLLMNDVIGIPYPADTADHVKSFFDESKPNTVQVLPFRTAYNNAMHAKLFVIDGTAAYMNASPLLQEYFDDITHRIDDPRRGWISWPKNVIKVPVHDVSIKLEGSVVKHLYETFALLWRQAGGTLPLEGPVPTPVTDTAVQIVRTLPGNLFTTEPDVIPYGETGIMEAYQRAIRNATDFIYLENQYFTERAIADALFLALQENPDLQLIMLVNNAVDVPIYHRLQSRLIEQLLTRVDNASGRVGVFTLWTHEITDEGQRIIRNYVHSKVGIVDDKWATIGSANLDGQGLILSQHIATPITKRDVLEERAIEVNTLIFNNVDGLNPSSIPDELRRKLWAEHLGFGDSDDPVLMDKPGGGWLSLWRERAWAKLGGLRNSPPTQHEARVLPWTRYEDPEDYFLRGLMISDRSLSNLTVETEVRSFNFLGGQWTG